MPSLGVFLFFFDDERDTLLNQALTVTDAVAIDPDDETRIVSTDKKAGRTGGISFFEAKGNARAGRRNETPALFRDDLLFFQ